jgi:two-component system alkaline phosphatase synthesis response regulator PhoP
LKQAIYVVEDDAALRELYIYSLENEFNCRCFDDGAAFYEALRNGPPDLVLLDIMLPGDDGFTILSKLKAEKPTSQIPVIIVSAKGDEISKVKGLNMGADDYIAKPFGVLELIARVKANLRKHNDGAALDHLSFMDIEIDHIKHRVIINGRQIPTTLKEYNLLAFLCKKADMVLDRSVIFDEVWGETFIGETRTLDIHIKELRKKLFDAGSRASIQTVRGVGYMLTTRTSGIDVAESEDMKL